MTAVFGSIVLAGILIAGCASKPAPRVPLPVRGNVAEQTATLNAQGIEEYQRRQFDQAKMHFQQVVAAAPTSAEAHYNLGLTLFAMGEQDRAREHFIEAANLAPGDRVIWDSPALRQYGSPDAVVSKPVRDPSLDQRPSFGGGRPF